MCGPEGWAHVCLYGPSLCPVVAAIIVLGLVAKMGQHAVLCLHRSVYLMPSAGCMA